MVVGVRHIHAALRPFVVFPDVELAPLVLDSSIRSRSGLPKKNPCRRTGIVSRLCGSSLGRAAGRVSGYILVFGTFLFKCCGQSNQNLVVIITLLVPFDGRLLVSIQVDHAANEGTGVESGGTFYPLAALALDIGEEIHSGLPSLSKVSVRNLCG